MNIKIICVGKLREQWHKQACDEYIKRLSRYCRLEIRQVDDERPKGKDSVSEKQRILETEGKRILSTLTGNETVVALDVYGKAVSSEEMAGLIEAWSQRGKSNIAIVIGGSFGLSEEILKKADVRLSMSKMTFNHMLARVIILEQIYRCFKIISNETYHK